MLANAFTSLRFSLIAAVGAVAISASPIAAVVSVDSLAQQQGPASVADLADGLLDAVVNIATTQKTAGNEENVPVPDIPEGSPFKDYFDEFFRDRDRDLLRDRDRDFFRDRDRDFFRDRDRDFFR